MPPVLGGGFPAASGRPFGLHVRAGRQTFPRGRRRGRAASSREGRHRHSPPLAARVEVSRGLLGGDVDGDGDVDLLVTQAGGPARLFRNDAPRRGRWLAVRAVDPRRGGRDVLGARVEVSAGGRTWTAPVVATTGYLTAVEPVVHFGLGEVEEVDWIEVVWPGGERERFAGGGAGRTVILQRGKGTRR